MLEYRLSDSYEFTSPVMNDPWLLQAMGLLYCSIACGLNLKSCDNNPSL